jgi:hypothetical protein
MGLHRLALVVFLTLQSLVFLHHIMACPEIIKMPTHGSFSPRLRYFPLKYIKYSCGKMPRLAKKSLATAQFC